MDPKKYIEAILGRDKILAFRLLKDAATEVGRRLAMQITHTLSYSRSTEQIQTKDGAVATAAGLEVSLSLEALASNDPVNAMLLQSVEEGEVLEIWEIDLSSKNEETGEYEALYMQGRLESWESPKDVNDASRITSNAKISGKPKEGLLTLTEDQEQALDYTFRTLEKYKAALDEGEGDESTGG